MSSAQLKWDVTKKDADLIQRIVVRALNSPSLLLRPRDREELEMDLTAVHRNVHPLRLRELLEADFFNFAHDIAGIRRHINRQTGNLENHFVPRFARPKR